MPADDRAVEARTIVPEQKAELKRVNEPDVGEVSRSRERSRRAAPIKRAAKTA